MKTWKKILFTIGATALLAACSPDNSGGSRILFVDDGSAAVFHTETGEIRRIAERMFPEGWSPSGSQILLRGPDGVHVYDETRDELARVLSLEEHPDWKIQQLAWLGEEDVLVVVEIGSGTFLRVIHIPGGEVSTIQPDAERSDVLASPGGGLWLQRTAGGVEVASLAGECIGVSDFWYAMTPYVRSDTVFSPDGSRIAYFHENQIWTAEISPAGLAKRRVLADVQDFTPDLTWSPDGKYIAFQDYESGNGQLRILNVDSGEQAYTHSWPGSVNQILWSPGSDAVLSFAGAPFVMQIRSGEISYPFGEEAYSVVTIMDWR